MFCTITKPLCTQSWTKLVETKAISARYGKTDHIAERLFLPPPPIQCCLEGLRFHQGNFGGKATLIRGRGGRFVVVSGFQGQSFHLFRRVSRVSSEIVALEPTGNEQSRAFTLFILKSRQG